ncbi:hypothetical protein SprV_0501901100 [Sparganum proliferum]
MPTLPTNIPRADWSRRISQESVQQQSNNPNICLQNRLCTSTTVSSTTIYTADGHNLRAPPPSITVIIIISAKTSATTTTMTTSSPSRTTDESTPDAESTTTLTTTAPADGDVNSVLTYPHGDRISTSRIGLIGRLRIHLTELGAPAPAIPSAVRTAHAHPLIAKANPVTCLSMAG